MVVNPKPSLITSDPAELLGRPGALPNPRTAPTMRVPSRTQTLEILRILYNIPVLRMREPQEFAGFWFPWQGWGALEYPAQNSFGCKMGSFVRYILSKEPILWGSRLSRGTSEKPLRKEPSVESRFRLLLLFPACLATHATPHSDSASLYRSPKSLGGKPKINPPHTKPKTNMGYMGILL